MTQARPSKAWIATGIGMIALGFATAAPGKNWGEWSPPASIESLPGSSHALNTPAVDGCASLSPDGLTLLFTSNRSGKFKLYTATRSSNSEGFGPPNLMPAPVNDSHNDSCPTLTSGKTLYFSSDRDDPANDIYVTKLGPDGWSEPENLGSNINTPGMLDESPAFYEDDQGREVMLFSSRRLDGSQGKIYQSVNGGPKSLVGGGPNSSASDNRPSVTRDGLTIFFDSTRYGTLGGPDLYYATRSNTSEPFGSAIHLQNLSSPAFDARPFISKDGSMLTYSSARIGSKSAAPDIWFSSRDKSSGK